MVGTIIATKIPKSFNLKKNLRLTGGNCLYSWGVGKRMYWLLTTSSSPPHSWNSGIVLTSTCQGHRGIKKS